MRLASIRPEIQLAVYAVATAGAAWLLVHARHAPFAWWWPVAIAAVSLALAFVAAPCCDDRLAPRLRTVALAAGVLAAAALAGRLSTVPGLEVWTVVSWICLVAIALALGAAAAAPERGEEVSRLRALPLGFGLALALLLAASAATLVQARGSLALALALWIGALLVGVLAAMPSSAWAAAPPHERLPAPVEAAIVLVLAAAAAALRLVAIGRIPVIVDGDEGRIGEHILRSLADAEASPFALGWNAFSHLAFAAQGAWLDPDAPRLEALRLGSVTAGVLGVLALYLLLRELCGWRVATIGGALLAANPEHLAWSRSGLMNVQAVTVVTLAMAFLALALRRGRLVWWSLLGVACGLCLLVYHAAKAAVGVVALVLAAELLVAAGERRRQLVAAAAVAAVLLAVTVLPHVPGVVADWPAYSQEVGGRFDVNELLTAWRAGDTPAVREHLTRHCGDVAAVPFSGRQGGFVAPGPLLGPITAVLFLGAPLWLLVWWRRLSSRLLLLWIATFAVVSGMLTFLPPYKPRLVMALPAVVAAAALAIDAADTRRGRGRGWTAMLPWLIAAACVGGGLADTWSRQVTPYAAPAGLAPHEPKSTLIHALRRLQAIGWLEHGRVLLLGSTNRDEANLYHSQRHGLLAARDVIADVGDDMAAVPVAEPFGRSLALLVAPPQDALLSALRMHYPRAEVIELRDPSGNLLFTELHLDRSVLADSHGWQPLAEAPDSVWPDLPVSPPFVLAAGTAGEWAGLVHAAAAGRLELEASGCPEVAIELDGAGGGGGTVSAHVAAGWHPVRLSARADDGGCAVEVRWRRDGSPDFEPVPRWAVLPALAPHGLVCRVWPDPAGQRHALEGGEPQLWRVDPVLSYDFDMVERQELLPPVLQTARWHARWDGSLVIPRDGTWTVEVAHDTAWAELQLGELAASGGGSDAVIRITGWLAAGSHPLLVRASSSGEAPLERLVVRLRWAEWPGPLATVPYEALRPAAALMVSSQP